MQCHSRLYFSVITVTIAKPQECASRRALRDFQNGSRYDTLFFVELASQ